MFGNAKTVARGTKLIGFQGLARVIPLFTIIIVGLGVLGGPLYQSVQQGNPSIFLIAIGERVVLADTQIERNVGALPNVIGRFDKITIYFNIIASVLILIGMIRIFAIIINAGVENIALFNKYVYSIALLLVLQWVVGWRMTGNFFYKPFSGFLIFIEYLHNSNFIMWLGEKISSWTSPQGNFTEMFNTTNITNNTGCETQIIDGIEMCVY